ITSRMRYASCSTIRRRSAFIVTQHTPAISKLEKRRDDDVSIRDRVRVSDDGFVDIGREGKLSIVVEQLSVRHETRNQGVNVSGARRSNPVDNGRQDPPQRRRFRKLTDRFANGTYAPRVATNGVRFGD